LIKSQQQEAKNRKKADEYEKKSKARQQMHEKLDREDQER